MILFTIQNLNIWDKILGWFDSSFFKQKTKNKSSRSMWNIQICAKDVTSLKLINIYTLFFSNQSFVNQIDSKNHI